MNRLQRSRLRAPDLFVLGANGLREHPLRAALSALGIAIGIAAMIAVIGISTSSQAQVQQRLEELGTNLLRVSAGADFFGEKVALSPDAPERLRRVEGVHRVGWLSEMPNAHVYRNSLIDPGSTAGLTVSATDDTLLQATGSEVLTGSWLTNTLGGYPLVVLGSKSAERLGITDVGVQLWLGGQNFTVSGILKSSPLAPELDATAFISGEVASSLFGFQGAPTTIYERSSDEKVNAVRKLIPRTVNPESPNEVEVSRPSDALAARNAIDQAFTGLLVGVGSIALLVGGIGVANTMVITVLERRKDIGLRRSLGATRSHIRGQFLVEAILLAAYGGVVGTLLGWGITAIVAQANGWTVSIPLVVLVAGVSVTVIVGAVAGVLPAVRAARTSPTAALAV